MIKFFRKIRYKLMSENKTGKYLKYAIGEIVLVVIGILIALQVNNWNVNRINKNLEQQILIELKKEFENNLAQLKEKHQIRSEFVMKSAGWLINYGDKTERNIDLDIVNHHLSRTLIVPSYDPMISVTTELINSGKLQLIQNLDLRTQLTKWPSITNDLVREEEQFVSYMYDKYTMFIIDHYKLRPLVNKLQNDAFIYSAINTKQAEFNIAQKQIKEEINQLFNNEDFEDYLSLIMGFCNFLNNTTNTLMEDNRNIIQLINSELINQ